MKRRRARTNRRALTVIVAIAALAILGVFVVLMAKFAALDMEQKREDALEARAYQLALSARAWTERHTAELAAGGAIQLPTDRLLGTATQGELELSCPNGGGERVVVCHVRLARSRQTLERRYEWALPAAATRPAVPDSTP